MKNYSIEVAKSSLAQEQNMAKFRHALLSRADGKTIDQIRAEIHDCLDVALDLVTEMMGEVTK